MASKFPIRVSLRTALILLTVLPLLVAMMYTRQLHVERFEYVSGRYNGYFHESMWKRYVWESQWHLEYLIVYLPRTTPGSARPGGVATSDVLATPVSSGISRIPAGLFFNGRLVNTKEAGKCFVYDPYKDDVFAIPIEERALDALTPQELKEGGCEEFWTKNLIPLLHQDLGS